MVKAKTRSKPVHRKAGKPQQIPVDTGVLSIQRNAKRLDGASAKRGIDRLQVEAYRKRVTTQVVRDEKSNSPWRRKISFTDLFSWPDALYVPQNDAKGFGFGKPPSANLYSDAWTDGKGASNANAATGTMFAWSQALTTERQQMGEAGLGIRYSPKDALSKVRFEPEVNCAITYRAFVDFWPLLIAGNVRALGSLIMACWQLSPVTGQPPELVGSWREVPVFDTHTRDAGSDLSPDIHNVNTLQRNFASSALATDFLVQGGRTYILGVIARVQVVHNVTSSDGKILTNDGTKFKLYSSMVCTVPTMMATVQYVFIP